MKKNKILVLVLVSVLIIGSYASSNSSSVNPVNAKDSSSLLLIPEVNEGVGLDGMIARRIDQEEDLNNIITYQLLDGSFMTQVFPIDVKYKDEFGVTKDKSNKLYNSIDGEYKWETRDNDIISKFPEYLDIGVVTEYKEVEISFKPIISNSNKAILSDNTIKYDNVFEDGISIIYTPTFNGTKDIIVLQQPPQTNCFEFIVETNGVEITKEGLLVYNNAVIGSLGKAEIVDSALKVSEKEIVFSEVIKGQKYSYQIIIPNELLLSNDTIYPVYVDPSLYFYTQYDYYGLQSNYSSNIHTGNCISGGYLTSDNSIKVGRSGTVILYEFLLKTNTLSPVFNILKDNIVSANLTLYTDSAYYGSATTLEVYPETESWTTNVNYTSAQMSSLYNGYDSSGPKSEVAIGANINANQSISISINNLLQSNSFFLSKGLLFKLSDPSALLSFYGYSSSYANRIPRISLNYTDTNSSGIISGGIYQLSPCDTPVTVSSLSLSNGLSLTSTDLSIDERTGYPLFTGPENVTPVYKSFMKNPSQLFKITNVGYGYTIQRITDNYYLSRVSGSNTLSFVSGDDSVFYSTRWFFVKTSQHYYITHCFSNYLNVDNFNYSVPGVQLVDYSQSMGTEWALDFYCLGVSYHEQRYPNTCGAACVIMILDWKGVSYTQTEDDIYDIADNSFGICADGYQYALSTIMDSDINYSGSHYGIPNDPYNFKNWVYRYMNFREDPEDDFLRTVFFVVNHYAVNSKDHYLYNISYNISHGYPVILNTKLTNIYAPFSYTNGGHYVLAIGLYHSSSDNKDHIVLLDPHYNTSEELVPFNQNFEITPALVDIEFDDFFDNIKKSNDCAIRAIPLIDSYYNS